MTSAVRADSQSSHRSPAGGSPPSRRGRGLTLRRRESLAGVLFTLPWILSLIAFTAYPVLASVFYSFTEYSVVQPPEWVGLANYERMFTNDPQFWIAVQNSAYYALISVPLGLVMSLVLALILNFGAKGIGFYRTLFYLPVLAPPVVATIVFMLMFSPDSGLVNTILRGVGLPTPGWLDDPSWSKPTLIILSLWALGASTLVFLAGLKEVPMSLLEAAAIDGAGPVRRFWHVTIPLLSPVILFNLVMGVINSFQVFTSAFIAGGTAGEPLDSTLMYVVLIYRSAFRYFAMGYASALSVILFLAVLVVTLLIFWSSKVWVFYAGRDQ
ncbi:carbohydrate ABC transporter permease [Tenggerimyces flavus]|uniref:Carbohydrate ABC transporter permease n=1 Tax=Tenggerimyces flavus TaxID=1708749 RepID=A0ABV7Y8U4_9ACTN|nr:sugar ABC transporter permease [Tenggerimyces flavus]MBM7785435.1 multiple sugar transport system permease protein [Tenggerimyces flavus]